MVTALIKNLITFFGISLFFLILSLNVQAQEGFKQRLFTSQNGLKISWVSSITKSQNNTFTIFHSSDFDLSRYDGYNFDYTISPTGIFGKTFEDFSGNLWSIDEGNLDNVNFYSNDKWQNLELDAGIPFIPTPGMGNRLLFIRDGDFKEFDKVKLQTRIIKRAEESQIGKFIDLTIFQDGSLWITGEDGVANYRIQCDTCDYQEQWIDFQVPKALGLYHFNKPFEGDNGELTLMSKSSKSKRNVLAGFDGKTWQTLYTSQTDELHYGWRGLDNSLWIIKGIQPPPPLSATLRDWNLYHVQQSKETPITKNRILNRLLNDVVVEPNGAFWLATGSGLAHFTPTLWRGIEPSSGTRPRIKKIHEDLTGRLWFAGEDSFYLWANGKWESYQFNPIVFTGDICSLKNGLLIVGISEKGGLALFNPNDKSSTIAFPFGNEKIRYYDQDKNGNCLIILQNSHGISKLIRYDGEHIETLAVDMKIDGLTPGACEVTDIIQVRNDDVWIVTFSEVIVFKKGIKKSFELKKEFEWGFSTSILELENGNIWISGSKGIIEYNGENWSHVQTPEFETARKMIISRDNSIWVASGTGIHRLINGIWVSNSNEEGLPSTTIFDVFEDRQGKIWAATLNGAYCFYPEADTNAPETLIPSDLNSKEAIPSGEIKFVFVGHDKWNNTPDDRIQYSYRLDENSWTSFENRTMVREVGLSTGPHVFEVRAMDRNGNIDPTPARWTFTVLLPWYLEAYFITLALLATSIIVLLIGFAVSRHLRVEKLVLTRTAELNKAKQEVEESERLLFKIAENYPNSFISIIERDLTIGFSSGQEFKRLNLDPDTFLGFTTEQVFGEHSPIIKENYLKSFNGEETTFELFINNQHQLYRTVPLIYENNKISKILSVVENITKRKQDELELNKYRKELEELVHDRTRELEIKTEKLMQQSEELHEQNIELDLQSKEVEEANRLKSEFLSTMSHELRTPLNSIINLSTVLIDRTKGKISDEESNYLEIIERNGKKQLELINDILDLSKIEAGKVEISPSDASVATMLGMIKDSLSILAVEKGITLNLKTPKKLPMVVTDESKLYQVFMNIAGNAVKFTDKGSVDIIVKNDVKNVYVDIQDTGIGISEEALPHIFDEFRQVDGSAARQHEGTGLGLSIAYKTMNLLFGTIRVKSTLGTGSVFTITIPINWAEIKEDTSEDKKSIPKPAIQRKKTLSKTELPKVLVVEDNPDNMFAIKAILKGNYDITEAFDGVAGLKQATKNLPDIILLDMNLPKMDGIEVVTILKNIEETKNIPVIAVTASAMKEVKESFLNAGCDAIVAKPIDQDLLFNKINEWL